jgi:hypothetical protein
MADGGNTVPRLAKAEHIGSDTGDNVEAKKVASYGFGTQSAWSRMPAPLIDRAFDGIAFSNADANGNYQTITFSDNGSAVRALTLAFDGSSKVTNITRT